MMNTICGTINNENPTSTTSPNESSKFFETKRVPPPSHQEEILEPGKTVTPPSLNFPPIKFELDGEMDLQQPSDAMLWDTYFADHLWDSSDFMISFPVKNLPSSPQSTISNTTTTATTAAPAPTPTPTSLFSYNHSNNNETYNNFNPYPFQTMQCSPPRFPSSHHLNLHHTGGFGGGGSSSSSYQRSMKGQSPIRRMFNSPNNYANSNTNNFQYMQVADCNSLASLPPAFGDFFDGYSINQKDHGFLSYSPMKLSDTSGNMSTQLYDDMSTMNNIPTMLDCLTMENSPSPSPSSASLSQQLQKERQQERQQENYSHGLMPSPLPTSSEQEQDSGLQLVHLLLVCAEALSKENYMLAGEYLHQLNRVVSSFGDSMQRVAACFTEALTARLAATLTTKPTTPLSAPPPLSPFSTLKSFISPNFPPNSFEVLKIYQILYQACPYVKFAHFTANQAILEAFEVEERVHIIDLDILQGYQWPAFMQALASREHGAPFLRITGFGPCLEQVKEAGRSLTELSHSLKIPFEFHAVGDNLEDLRPHMFNRRVGEALAVNAVNKLHRISGHSLGNLLTIIRDQAPNIVTLVEQEASHNGPYFLGRFLEALHYYSAIFDSLDATFPPDSAQRAKVEQCIFAPEIRNIVACEGAERIERHERLEKWRKFMEGKGFQGVPLSANAVSQSKILLGLYSCDGYRLTEDNGCLLLGWQDRAILAASAWRC